MNAHRSLSGICMSKHRVSSGIFLRAFRDFARLASRPGGSRLGGWVVLAVLLLGAPGRGMVARGAEEAGAESGGAGPAAAPAKGRLHCIVGLSPFLEAADRDEVFRHLVRFAVEEMPLDSTLSLYDAYHLRTIATLTIPEVRAFRSPKTRLNQFAEAIQSTRRFLARTNARPRTPGLDFAGALRIPQFLEFVADHHAAPNQRQVVVLLGSPLHQDEKEPAFSMAGGYFPSDGHLLATRDQSVYGLRDRGGRLEGTSVHVGYFGDPWATELHREKIARFWRLFVERQQGRWSGLAGDLPTVFQLVKRDFDDSDAGANRARTGPAPEPDPTRTKVEMLRVTREVGVTDWIAGDAVTRPAAGPPAGTTGPLKIGIRWQGKLDFDLYARSKPGATRLYFEQTRAPEGYYYKDHRASPDREYEFIEFVEPVDVRQVEAEINLYDGTAPAGGADGEVRLEYEGRIHAGRFQLPARQGNRGREGAGQGAYWHRLDLPGILGLR